MAAHVPSHSYSNMSISLSSPTNLSRYALGGGGGGGSGRGAANRGLGSSQGPLQQRRQQHDDSHQQSAAGLNASSHYAGGYHQQQQQPQGYENPQQQNHQPMGASSSNSHHHQYLFRPSVVGASTPAAAAAAAAAAPFPLASTSATHGGVNVAVGASVVGAAAAGGVSSSHNQHNASSSIRNATNANAITTQHSVPGTSANANATMALSYEDLVRRIAGLNTRLATMEEREVAGINTAHRTLETIREGVSKMGTVVANLELKVSKDLTFLEDSVEERLKEEALKRAEVERQIHKTIHDELEALRTQIANGHGGDGGAMAGYTGAVGFSSSSPASPSSPTSPSFASRELKELNLKLNLLNDEIDKKSSAIKRSIEESVRELQGNVQGVLEALETHRKNREVSEKALVDMIEDTIVSLQHEIEEERRERAASHKHLERVLLEAASRQWTRA